MREIKHLRELFETEIANLHTLLDERYGTQTKALDAAFVAAEKAVATALESADRAVTKAEDATKRQFESYADTIKGLGDQAATALSRAEADVRLSALSDRVDKVEQGATAFITRGEYVAAHEQLRVMITRNNEELAEHKGWDIEIQGKLSGAMDSLKSRYAGISVALGVVMTVLIIVVTVIGVVTRT
jgi:hypothetical protein